VTKKIQEMLDVLPLPKKHEWNTQIWDRNIQQELVRS
jgi:hypothetical protein